MPSLYLFEDSCFFGTSFCTSGVTVPLTVLSYETSQSLFTILGDSLKVSVKKSICFALLSFLHFSIALDILVAVHLMLLAARCMSHRVNKTTLVTFTSRSVAYLGFHFGGGSNFLGKSGGICMHGAKRHAARGEATRLLGGFGGMLPRENF